MTRVLIVDDEPENLRSLEAVLAPEGYELRSALSSAEAWRLAQAERPDVVLLDVMMPAENGFELCRRFRRSDAFRDLSIILVTALDDEYARLDGLEAGANDFLSKPVQKDELRARLRTIAALIRFRHMAGQRERFQRLFEVTPSATLLVNDRGEIVMANDGARRLLAVAAGTPLEGRPLQAWFDEGADRRLDTFLKSLVRSENSATVPSVRLARRAGEQILAVRASLLGELCEPLLLLVLDDVTAEVRAREELERFNRDLEAQVRARTVQLKEANSLLLSYAGFVSHDLRSPLAVLKGYLSMLDSGILPLAEAGPIVTECLEASKSMEEMIDNILQLAREEHAATPVQAIDPRPVVERVIKHIAAWAGERRPKFVLEPMPECHVRAGLLERVMYNLIGNAVKYSAHRSDSRVEIGGWPVPEGVVLFVRDNGAGFDERHATRLFQEFSRLDSAAGTDGVGLGLALVGRLLRAHRAKIWAEGKVGIGATFYVHFPAPGSDAEVTTTPPETKREPA